MKSSADKKPYLVSIHSHGGSFWEASGDHHVVLLTDEELKLLDEAYQYEQIHTETYVLIQPLSAPMDYVQIMDIIHKEIDENTYEDEDAEKEYDIDLDDDTDDWQQMSDLGK